MHVSQDLQPTLYRSGTNRNILLKAWCGVNGRFWGWRFGPPSNRNTSQNANLSV